MHRYMCYSSFLSCNVIAGVDKDLLQIPGYHYHLKKGTLEHISWYDAIRNFFIQCLMGDTADNIPGVPGIGRVKAKKALDKTPVENSVSLEYFHKICSALVHTKYVNYVENNITEEDKKMFSVSDLADKLMDENASLVWIRKYKWENWKEFNGPSLV